MRLPLALFVVAHQAIACSFFSTLDGLSETKGVAADAGSGDAHVGAASPRVWKALSTGTTASLWGLTGRAPDDVVAAGDTATILRFNGGVIGLDLAGTSWEREIVQPPDGGVVGALRAIHNDYAVGAGGTILKRTAPTTWTAQASGSTVELRGVWGASGSIYAVGVDGLILHSTGNGTWTPEPSNTTQPLRGVWGTSNTDIYAVGDGGTILHSEGRGTWTVLPSGTSTRLYSIWGGAFDLYAVGDGGAIVHRKLGGAWAPERSPTNVTLYCVWGTPSGDVYASGGRGTILHSDGQGTWTAEATNRTEDLRSIWGTSPDQVVVVGVGGVALVSTTPP